MMGLRFIFGAIALLLVTISRPVLATENGLTLFAPAVVTVDFDPFDGNVGSVILPLEMTVSDTIAPPDAIANYRVVIRPEIATDFIFEGDATALTFTLDAPGAQRLPNSVEFVQALQTGRPTPVEVRLDIPPGQYANAGTFDVSLVIEVYADSVGGPALAERITRVSATIPSRAQLNLAGTNSNFDNPVSFATLDFGNIIFDDSRTLNIQIRGNSDVDITMESENSGFLIDQEKPDASPIPYTVNLDGEISDMRVPLQFMRRPDPSLVGTRYPLTVTLGRLSEQAYSGNYEDILTIDVTPR